ncbi:MAG: hypothetical protein B7Z08_02665 [Sphingomonadales bacterium 32-68-7]|nr:MAG: hypothetical protein B7Z08_02665 [Sphingomonadales bacterium 32-68-7]
MEGGLDRLTDRERRVLRLLAGGHTVKSAATAEHITDSAANELLRSARRKLGCGSSRDAARRLAASEGPSQQNRDERIVVPEAAVVAEVLASLNKETIAMIASAIASAAAPPRVVSTEPAEGQEIAPGPFTLAVTFDRAMAPRSYSFCQNLEEGAFPQAAGPPQLSADGLTYSLDCVAEAGCRRGSGGGSRRAARARRP